MESPDQLAEGGTFQDAVDSIVDAITDAVADLLEAVDAVVENITNVLSPTDSGDGSGEEENLDGGTVGDDNPSDDATPALIEGDTPVVSDSGSGAVSDGADGNADSPIGGGGDGDTVSEGSGSSEPQTSGSVAGGSADQSASLPVNDQSPADFGGMDAGSGFNSGSNTGGENELAVRPEYEATTGMGAGSCADSDGDGVCDSRDACPDTPRNVVVFEHGCHLEKGMTLNLEGVHFENNSATLLAGSEITLDMAVYALKNTRVQKVEVAGHTSSVGRADHNLRLSQQRAETVLSYLVARGVAPERLEARGYGEESP
ncbi:MAG: OmpA family protein, partial [Spongiibacter sp.]